jgi:hypothetical protein
MTITDVNEIKGTCSQCGRDVIGPPDGYYHKDKRVKHPIPQIIMEPIPVASATEEAPPRLELEGEEEDMAPRTRTTTPDGETYTAVLSPEDPEDQSLLATAQEVFENEVVVVDGEPIQLAEEVENTGKPAEIPTDEEEQEVTPGGVTPAWGQPTKDQMVTVRGGGLYLTARRRIVWLRGEPVPHPDWTIDTYAEEIERGKYISNNKVEGGYARYRANVFDETGRLIGTGTKTEFSERFMDFAEKAETGAIARALAVCGYGTEAALDLDEGTDQDRIADAPVADTRPISISPSNVSGLVQGGRSENITQAQLNEIGRLVGQAAMGMTLVPFIEGVLNVVMPELGDDPTATITAFLQELSFSEAATLIQALNRALIADA